MKTIWYIYAPGDGTHDGELIEGFENEQDALDFAWENPGCIIAPETFTDKEWAQMEADSLPGVQGYYPE